MKVCDKHPDRKAVDSIHVEQDDIRADMCDECKYAVLSFLNGAQKEIEGKDKKSFLQRALGK